MFLVARRLVWDAFTWTVTNTNQAPVFSTDITDQSDAEGDLVAETVTPTERTIRPRLNT